MQPSVFTFSYADFTAAYPYFSDPTVYPVATLQNFWNQGVNYIDPTNYGWMRDGARYQALNLMVAHLAQLNDLIIAGEVPSVVQAGTVDKINVTLTPPPLKNQFQWWLSLTAYGQQLLSLLQVQSVGGDFIGGSPQRSSFRGLPCWRW